MGFLVECQTRFESKKDDQQQRLANFNPNTDFVDNLPLETTFTWEGPVSGFKPFKGR
jgi:hypothetical protein